MKQNIGNLDRIIRIVVALTVAILYFTHLISGTVAIILGIFAIVLIITSFIRFCPLYLPFWYKHKQKVSVANVTNLQKQEDVTL